MHWTAIIPYLAGSVFAVFKENIVITGLLYKKIYDQIIH
jgi:hypothetical protein